MDEIRTFLELAKNFKKLDGYLITVITGIIGFSAWDGSFEGGDIAAARRSYLSDSPIDIWGGFSGMFYSGVPSKILPWGAWLLIIHLILSSLGILVLRSQLQINSTAKKIIFLIFCCIFISFTSYLTRDSTLGSFYMLGISLIIFGKNNLNIKDKVCLSFGIIFILVGTAFRPWLFLPAILLIFILKLKIREIIVLIAIVSVVPFCLDRIAYSVSDLKSVHPELQVIILDSASLLCMGTQSSASIKSLKILNEIDNNMLKEETICSEFQPNTWQSVGYWAKNDSQSGKLSTNSVVVNEHKIIIPIDMPEDKYNRIKNMWLDLILSEPQEYLQIKSMQFTQILISGDTLGLRILNRDPNKKYFSNLISGLVFLPYDVVISLHIISPILSFILGSITVIFLHRRRAAEHIFLCKDFIVANLFLLAWTICSAIAFLGDNGRYVYTSSFIYFVLLSAVHQRLSEQDLIHE